MYASEEQTIEGSIPYTRTSSNLYHLEKINIRYTFCSNLNYFKKNFLLLVIGFFKTVGRVMSTIERSRMV